jgi:3-oxoacyl-[acyl-carrier protein] reductase
VLVLGASRGLGQVIATWFAERGDRITTTHHTTVPDSVLPNTLHVSCDVTVTADVNRAFADAEQANGLVEVLVVNAGIASESLLLGMRDEQFDSVVATNLGGAFRAARRALPGMLRLGRGRLIFVSSVAGHRGFPGQANYAASKAGLLGLTRSLARELGPRNITVNAVAPGLIDAGMTSQLAEDQKHRIIAQTPLGRCGTAQEVAAAIHWLASPGAGYVSGALIPVDGGLGMGY